VDVDTVALVGVCVHGSQYQLGFTQLQQSQLVYRLGVISCPCGCAPSHPVGVYAGVRGHVSETTMRPCTNSPLSPTLLKLQQQHIPCARAVHPWLPRWGPGC
jgi:hypothetical protein